ncbi:hypothetical protein K1719_017274 [Acacia pycnantha]|nr:hypothetical protein K1719_017274 [Acacia pycnantha]
MKKKRLQLQARKASLSYYLHPFQNNRGFSFHGSNTPWFYDPSSYNYSEFSLYEEPQISFKTNDQDAVNILNGFDQKSNWNNSSSLSLPSKQDTCMFTLSHTDHNRPFNFPAASNQSHSNKGLDLQLGLTLQSNTHNLA